jgi:hypothetical protein
MGNVHLEALIWWWEFDAMSLRYQRPLQPSIIFTPQVQSERHEIQTVQVCPARDRSVHGHTKAIAVSI